MSSTIASVSELVAVIQHQLSGRVQGASPAKRVAGVGQGSTARRYTNDKLAGLIELRVRQIGRDDPQRGRKAFRVFLEVVLLAHFGEHMVNDPKFHQMIDDVQGAMEADAPTHALIAKAIAYLLAADPPQVTP